MTPSAFTPLQFERALRDRGYTVSTVGQYAAAVAMVERVVGDGYDWPMLHERFATLGKERVRAVRTAWRHYHEAATAAGVDVPPMPRLPADARRELPLRVRSAVGAIGLPAGVLLAMEWRHVHWAPNCTVRYDQPMGGGKASSKPALPWLILWLHGGGAGLRPREPVLTATPRELEACLRESKSGRLLALFASPEEEAALDQALAWASATTPAVLTEAIFASSE